MLGEFLQLGVYALLDAEFEVLGAGGVGLVAVSSPV